MAAHNKRRHLAKRARSCATRNPRPRGYSPLGTPKRWSANEKAKKCRSAAFFLTLFRRPPHWPLRGQNGASRTPPPTNCQKAAPRNRNCEQFHCRVLAPGRGQSVRSWILKGALAKRSCVARTQAPLSRAAVRSRSDQSPSGALKHTSGPALRDGGHRFGRQARAIGSSGTLFGSFWGSKRNI